MLKYLLLMSLLTACGESTIYIGPTGERGKDGENCTITPATNGAVVKCPDQSNVLILNGVNGIDSTPSVYSIVGIVDPCGPDTNYFNEILLKLANNTFVAFFENGSQKFLSQIPPGNYVTGDHQHCYFTVKGDGNIINEHT